MNSKQTQLDWGLALKWSLSCAIGTAVLGMAAYASMWQVADSVGGANDLIKVAVAGAIFGALMALGGNLGPAFLLRSVGISAARWIGFSALVTAVITSTGVTIISSQEFYMGEALVSTLFVGLTLGLSMGIVQWWLLKQQQVSAALWPLVTAAGYTLAFGIVVYFSGEGREWLALIGMGLVLGLVTGLGMMWLRRRESAVAI